MESIKRLDVGSLLSPVILVSPMSPISKVVGMLKETNAYEAFLEENGKIGIVTTRDLLKASNITTTKASSLALYLPKLSPKSTIAEAARLMMEYRIRALPVVENNNLIGNIRAISIINAMKDSNFSKIMAQNIMTGNPVTLSRDSLVSKARGLMVRRKIDHIPVLSGNKLCGILTSNHIVFNMFQATETIQRSLVIPQKQKKLEFPLGYIADSNPLTCQPNDNISVVLDEMVRLGTTYSIVTLLEEVQGIITYRDYMKLVTEQLSTNDIPVYIVGLPEDPFEAEAARSKFLSAVKLLKKPFPFIEEAKAVIKTYAEGNKMRKRYEISVSLVTPKKVFSYTESGWDLPKVFEIITNKLKKMLAEKPSRRGIHREEKYLQLAGEEGRERE